MDLRALFRMAWRNIWRNKRRTYITAASIAFAVFAAVAMRSLQDGMWDNMLQEVIEMQTGYLQITKKGYLETPSVNEAFPRESWIDSLSELEDIEYMLPRFQSFALAAQKETTRGVAVMGVQPMKEDSMSGLSNRLVKGSYWSRDDQNGVILDSNSADYLGLGVGDTLVMISSGFRGANAAGKYSIRALMNIPVSAGPGGIVYMPLHAAQYFFRAEDRVTAVIPVLKDADEVEEIQQAISSRIDTNIYEVVHWEQMIPELVESRAFDEGSGYVILIILYLLVAFGIFGTLLMMLQERNYEFGILNAVGMKKKMLSVMLWMEIMLVGFMGVVGGIIITMPIILYFKISPIRISGEMAEAYEQFNVDPLIITSLEPSIFLNQAIIVFILVSAMAIYPFYQIRNMKVIEALRP